MIKQVHRFAAVVLIPALLLDPSTAATLHGFTVGAAPSISASNALFGHEAVIAPLFDPIKAFSAKVKTHVLRVGALFGLAGSGFAATLQTHVSGATDIITTIHTKTVNGKEQLVEVAQQLHVQHQVQVVAQVVKAHREHGHIIRDNIYDITHQFNNSPYKDAFGGTKDFNQIINQNLDLLHHGVRGLQPGQTLLIGVQEPSVQTFTFAASDLHGHLLDSMNRPLPPLHGWDAFLSHMMHNPVDAVLLSVAVLIVAGLITYGVVRFRRWLAHRGEEASEAISANADSTGSWQRVVAVAFIVKALSWQMVLNYLRQWFAASLVFAGRRLRLITLVIVSVLSWQSLRHRSAQIWSFISNYRHRRIALESSSQEMPRRPRRIPTGPATGKTLVVPKTSVAVSPVIVAIAEQHYQQTLPEEAHVGTSAADTHAAQAISFEHRLNELHGRAQALLDDPQSTLEQFNQLRHDLAQWNKEAEANKQLRPFLLPLEETYKSTVRMRLQWRQQHQASQRHSTSAPTRPPVPPIAPEATPASAETISFTEQLAVLHARAAQLLSDPQTPLEEINSFGRDLGAWRKLAATAGEFATLRSSYDSIVARLSEWRHAHKLIKDETPSDGYMNRFNLLQRLVDLHAMNPALDPLHATEANLRMFVSMADALQRDREQLTDLPDPVMRLRVEQVRQTLARINTPATFSLFTSMINGIRMLWYRLNKTRQADIEGSLSKLRARYLEMPPTEPEPSVSQAIVAPANSTTITPLAEQLAALEIRVRNTVFSAEAQQISQDIYHWRNAAEASGEFAALRDRFTAMIKPRAPWLLGSAKTNSSLMSPLQRYEVGLLVLQSLVEERAIDRSYDPLNATQDNLRLYVNAARRLEDERNSLIGSGLANAHELPNPADQLQRDTINGVIRALALEPKSLRLDSIRSWKEFLRRLDNRRQAKVENLFVGAQLIEEWPAAHAARGAILASTPVLEPVAAVLPVRVNPVTVVSIQSPAIPATPIILNSHSPAPTVNHSIPTVNEHDIPGRLTALLTRAQAAVANEETLLPNIQQLERDLAIWQAEAGRAGMVNGETNPNYREIDRLLQLWRQSHTASDGVSPKVRYNLNFGMLVKLLELGAVLPNRDPVNATAAHLDLYLAAAARLVNLRLQLKAARQGDDLSNPVEILRIKDIRQMRNTFQPAKVHKRQAPRAEQQEITDLFAALERAQSVAPARLEFASSTGSNGQNHHAHNGSVAVTIEEPISQHAHRSNGTGLPAYHHETAIIGTTGDSDGAVAVLAPPQLSVTRQSYAPIQKTKPATAPEIDHLIQTGGFTAEEMDALHLLSEALQGMRNEDRKAYRPDFQKKQLSQFFRALQTFVPARQQIVIGNPTVHQALITIRLRLGLPIKDIEAGLPNTVAEQIKRLNDLRERVNRRPQKLSLLGFGSAAPAREPAPVLATEHALLAKNAEIISWIGNDRAVKELSDQIQRTLFSLTATEGGRHREPTKEQSGLWAGAALFLGFNGMGFKRYFLPVMNHVSSWFQTHAFMASLKDQAIGLVHNATANLGVVIVGAVAIVGFILVVRGIGVGTTGDYRPRKANRFKNYYREDGFTDSLFLFGLITIVILAAVFTIIVAYIIPIDLARYKNEVRNFISILPGHWTSIVPLFAAIPLVPRRSLRTAA